MLNMTKDLGFFGVVWAVLIAAFRCKLRQKGKENAFQSFLGGPTSLRQFAHTIWQGRSNWKDANLLIRLIAKVDKFEVV